MPPIAGTSVQPGAPLGYVEFLTPYIDFCVVRVSHQTKLVLQVFLDAPSDETYGFEIARAAGLPAGTIYPILRRLENAGWIDSRWEEIDESEEGRRRRRYYRLTGEGRRAAQAAVADQTPALRMLVPGWST